MRLISSISAFIAVMAVGQGHQTLFYPVPIGYNSALEQTSPCDSFSPSDRSKVADWPLGGHTVEILTTHNQATWEFRMAKLPYTGTWVKVTPTLNQTGFGYLCEPYIPGYPNWGTPPIDAVLQVVQHADDGTNYQVRAYFVAFIPPAAVVLG
jgi:hypothetical protein